MANIFIRNHDLYNVVLEYQLGVGPIKVQKRINLPPDVKTEKGFYVEVDTVFIGVFASKDGPVFFHNNEEYSLTDKRFKADVQKRSDEYTFTLRQNNEARVIIKYPPVKYKDYDNWSDEITLDFFLWLTDSLSNDQEAFQKYFTQ
ncbi:MAG TPA: hypothetical protein PKE62_07725 [Anaerolineales bacterium]|nr:hypothetical protein [Anaerolineales bacterium]